jgi:hypothetical protein
VEYWDKKSIKHDHGREVSFYEEPLWIWKRAHSAKPIIPTFQYSIILPPWRDERSELSSTYVKEEG